jgi:hypothetical protein
MCNTPDWGPEGKHPSCNRDFQNDSPDRRFLLKINIIGPIVVKNILREAILPQRKATMA